MGDLRDVLGEGVVNEEAGGIGNEEREIESGDG